ncbi:hypothetical protein [Streptosporangium saharense]|uniref:Uncharacterized protein n=1 Tax=Streptosporangium saharense TaxID=1706840 RepID=A0A7W7VPE6_9ACTN|nr:hypothetical protein [Streptosporangium saharense]MBB4917429.1 hypothetical protein [Streptosporangium saharense]
MSAPDVSRMTREQLAEHVDGCQLCGADDPQIRAGARDSSVFLGDLRDYVSGAHDPRWLAIAEGAKS